MATLLPLPLLPKSLPRSSSSSSSQIKLPPTSVRAHQFSSLCKQGRLREAFDLLAHVEFESELPVGPEIFGQLLQGCLYQRALPQGRQIHGRILKSGPIVCGNEYIDTKLLIFYAKCGCLATAEELFRRQCRHNVFSWAAMIGLRCRLGLDEEALLCFVQMLEDDCYPDNFVIPNALKACSSLQSIDFGRGIHGYSLKMGFGNCVYVLSSLVDFYGKCQIWQDARNVFDAMPERNVISWNSMLVCYVHNGLNLEALELFHRMRTEGIQPTRVSISCFLTASANLEALDEGRQAHAIALFTGLELDNILGSSLINFYCKLGFVEDAELVFNQVFDKDPVIWNLMISGHVQEGQIDEALTTCFRMKQAGFNFDSVTLTSLIAASAFACDLKLCRVAHSYCLKNNLDSELAVTSSLIDSYARCGRMDYAQQVFDLTASRDLVIWNTMISACVHNGMSGEALKLFYKMQMEGKPANAVSWNSVIWGFLRNGQVDEAKCVFLEMQKSGLHPNLITWTSLIHGFAQNGCGYQAIELFVQMQSAGIIPNPKCIVALLLACTSFASQHHGRVVHGYIMRRGLLLSPYVATSLIDMYAKCGSIELASSVFSMVSHRPLPVYNALIFALALHGQAKEAIAIYNNICETGIKPDEITFTGLLSACIHVGDIDECIRILNEMVSVYHITPQKEHLGCFIALLARHGRINGMFDASSAMSVRPDAHVLASLLALCKVNQDVELAEDVSRWLFDIEPENAANYVTLANLYATTGRWQEASELRMFVKQSGFIRNPGCSWIQIRGVVHLFVAGDQSHPQMDDLARTLLCLDREMRTITCSSSMDKFGQIDVDHGSLCC